MKPNLEQISDRFKASARKLGVDVNRLASRYAAEQIVSHMGMKLTFAYATGGLCLPYTRETSDADMVLMMTPTEKDIGKAMTIIARQVRSAGIDITAVSKPQEIHVGLPKPVIRVKVQATVGNIRANTQLDMRIWDKKVFPNTDRILVERQPLFRDALPFRAYCQSPDISVAEKMLALMLQRGSDLRTKYLSDIVNPDFWHGLTIADVGKQLHRTAMLRDLTVPETPPTLSWEHISRLGDAWAKDANAQRTGLSLYEAFSSVRDKWADCYEEFMRYEAMLTNFHRPFASDEMLAHVIYRSR